MPGPSDFLSLAAPLSSSLPPGVSDVALAYVGLGPGQEFIPYFFGLLGVIGAALLAVLQWPFAMLLRYLRSVRGKGKAPGNSVAGTASRAAWSGEDARPEP
jgi:hypothetical protein